MNQVKNETRYTGVSRLIVPRSVLDATWEHLKMKGRLGEEEMALWAGYRENGCGFVATALLPLTRSYPYFVTIDNNQRLVRLWDAIASQKQCLLAQLHTHAGSGMHSATDDHGCISDATGMLSVVVPYFAHFGFRGLDGPGMAVYERQNDGTWKSWEKDEVRQRCQVVEDKIMVL